MPSQIKAYYTGSPDHIADAGTWTKPAGAVSVRVILIGGGGGGSSNASSGNAGGFAFVGAGGGGGAGGKYDQINVTWSLSM